MKYDVIVIGGGVSGLGVSLEAASRGLTVCLLEKGELGRATSANSHHIIHGGFRYLKNLDLSRAIDSIKEKNSLLKASPQYISPLPCVMPLDKSGMKSRYPVRAALGLYEVLSRFYTGTTGGGAVRDQEFVDEEIPLLKGRTPHGVLLWWDGLLEDHAGFISHIRERLVGEGRMTLLEGGEVVAVEVEDPCSVTYRTREGMQTIRGRTVVNCTGPWLSHLQVQGVARAPLSWCKAFNVILSSQLDDRYGIGVEGSEKRLYFIVPRGDRTAIGTGYTPFDQNPETVRVTEEELAFFLKGLDGKINFRPITVEDIERVEVGVLPLGEAGPSGVQPMGRERIVQHGPYLDVISTKYTTFKSQGRRVVTHLEKILFG